jgi:hypothetical protein
MVGGVSNAANVSKAANTGGSSIVSKTVGQTVQGMLGDAIGGMDKTLKLLTTMTGFGLPLTLINKTLDALLSGIESGFQAFLKIMSGLGKMLGALIMPFVNLLIPLMLPIFQILKPLVTLLNIFLKPLMVLLMNTFKNASANLGEAIKLLLGGDIMGALNIYIQYLITQLQAMFEFFRPMLEAGIKALIDAVKGFLTLDLEKVKEVFSDLFGSDIGGIITGFVEIIQKAGSAIIGFISQIVGKDMFDQIFGSGEFDNIKKTNEGFAIGISLAETLQNLWAALEDFVNVIWPSVSGWFLALVDPVGTMVTAFIDFVNNQWKGADGLESYVAKAIQQFKRMVDVIKTFLDVTWNGTGGLKSSIDTMAKAAASFAKMINSISKTDIIKAATNAIGGVVSSAKSALGIKNDFVMRPGQGAVSFSPDDTIIGVKDTSKLGGGNNFTININGSGLSESQLKNAVTDAIETFMSDSSRRGIFYKGY